MRKALDALYGAALVGACLSMIAIAALVFVQVMARVVDVVAVFLGMPRYGFIIPSLAEIGGFLFVASAFLALAATLRSAGHVRVTLLLRWFGPTGNRVMTFLVLAVALGLTAFAVWSVWNLTYASFLRGSLSVGIVAIPLWIPQGVMTLGLVIFGVALLDELAAMLRGRDPAFRTVESQREISEGGH